ncbi:hypothetical protein ACFXI6_14575 [Streptomyces mirabilis]|uniref:hypothetical protein n=1 Tax=Streptomyces mirabilis TaxID=68239 RepID=UPI003690E6E3
MGMELADYGPKPTTVEVDEQRRAAVRIADHFGRENPHHLDEKDPRQAGRELGKDPVIAGEVLDLIAVFGLSPDRIRRAARLPLITKIADGLRCLYIRVATRHIAALEAELSVAIAENQHLKEAS